jgi:hypothetical protein
LEQMRQLGPPGPQGMAPGAMPGAPAADPGDRPGTYL